MRETRPASYAHQMEVTPSARRVCAFTLVEILVVIAIIGILLAVVFRGGSALVRSTKTRDTEALLKKLDMALDEYKREVDHSRVQNATSLFNGFPPDDLRVFHTSSSVSVGGCDIRMRNTGRFRLDGSVVSNANDLIDPRNSSSGQLTVSPDRLLHADIRAMVLAMRLYSPRATKILDSIDPAFWADNEQVGEFLFDPGDNSQPIKLDFLVDTWGNPLEYFATCRCRPGIVLTPREETSNAFIHENNDGALLVSYGPNGSDQFAADMMSAEGDTSMVADYFPDRGVNHEFNNDNVYSSDFFANRIRKAAP